MPKRMRDPGDNQGHRCEPAHPDSNLPSPAQRMPGGWWWDDEVEYIPTSTRWETKTCWKTIRELAAAVKLTNLFDYARRFRGQRIVAQPAISRDGYSNKKRLIDAGVAKPPEPPKTRRVANPTPNFTRNFLLSYEREALDNYPSPNSMPGSWFDNQRALANRVYEGVAEFWRARQPGVDSVDDSLDIDSPVFASTPRGSFPSAPTHEEPTSSRKILSPISKLRAQSIALEVSQQSSPPSLRKFDKRIARVIATTPADGHHTRIIRNTTPAASLQSSISQSPHTRIYRKTTAFQLAADQVVKDAHNANIQYKAAHDARVSRIAEALPDNETQEVNDSFVYQNDMSDLPDAPPAPEKKTVAWHRFSRTKTFLRDTKVDEMHDSFLEDVKTCDSPEKARAQREMLEQQARHLSSLVGLYDDTLELPQGPAHEVMDEVTDVPMLSYAILDNYWKQKEHELLSTRPEPAQPAEPAPAPVKKPLISDLTESELQDLQDAAKRSDNGLVTDYQYVRGIEAHDLGTLLPSLFNGAASAWLNDNIINEYLGLLVGHCQKAAGWTRRTGAPAPVHAFASQWYTNFKKSYANVEKWPRRWNLTGRNLLGSEIILIPICENMHWTLLVIRPTDRVVEYFDSLGGAGRKYTEAALSWLAAELGPDFVADEWRVAGEQRSQRQANGSDCGVFTLLNALVVLRRDEHSRVVVDNGMGAARRRIAVSLLDKKPTGEMEP